MRVIRAHPLRIVDRLRLGGIVAKDENARKETIIPANAGETEER